MISFKSVITIKLLKYYFINPTAKHHINELARLLNVDAGNLYRKLQEFEAEGLFVSETDGNQRHFMINKKYSLFKELKKSFEVEHGLPDAIKEILKKIKGIDEAYIFGSYGKKQLKSHSDIDVLLIGNHSAIEAKRAILPLEKVFGREINIIDLSKQEFNAKIAKKDEFILDIFSHRHLKLI